MKRRTIARNHAHIGVALISVIAASGCIFQGGQISSRSSAAIIDSKDGLIGGDQAEGRFGDILLKNSRVRVIIQNVAYGRTEVAGPGVIPWGGNIIDADILRAIGEKGHDTFGKMTLLYNFGRTARYQSVRIIDDGSLTGDAVVEAVGEDALLETLNLEAYLRHRQPDRAAALTAAPVQRKNAVPVRITTRYTLPAGAAYVEIETVFQNSAGGELTLHVGDVIDAGGSVDPFVVARENFSLAGNSAGFEGIDEAGYNGTGLLAFASQHSSFGYVPFTSGIVGQRGNSVCINQAGVYSCQLGLQLTTEGELKSDVLAPRFTGLHLTDIKDGVLRIKPFGTARFRRYVAIGSGDTASVVAETESFLQPGKKWGLVEGAVRGPATLDRSTVRVAALRDDGSWKSPVAVARLDDRGNYEFRLPPGNYIVTANAPGYPYPTASGAAGVYELEFLGRGEHTPGVDFVFGATGEIEAFVQDDLNVPSPARITVFGVDGAPDAPGVADKKLVLDGPTALATATKIFPWWPVPATRLVTPELTLTDWEGESASVGATAPVMRVDATGIKASVRFPVEPGDYVLMASRGPEYGIDLLAVKVVAGQASTVSFRVPRVIDSYQSVAFDTSILSSFGRSPARTALAQVRAALAEGLDVYASSDADFISDHSRAVVAETADFDDDGEPNARADQLIAALPGQRVSLGGLAAFGSFPDVQKTLPPNAPELLSVVDEQTMSTDESDEARGSLGGGAVQWQRGATKGAAAAISTPTQVATALRAGKTGNQIVVLHTPRGVGDNGHQSFFDNAAFAVDFAGQYVSVPDASIPDTVCMMKRVLRDPGQKAFSAAVDEAHRALFNLPQAGDIYTDLFDAIEIYTPSHWPARSRALVDVFTLWNKGRRVVVVAGSGSRGETHTSAGAARMYVDMTRAETKADTGAQVGDGQQMYGEVLCGRGYASTAPLMNVSAQATVFRGNGAVSTDAGSLPTTLAPGDEYQAGINRCESQAAAGYDATACNGQAYSPIESGYYIEVTLTVRVQSPTWAPISKIQVFSNTRSATQAQVDALAAGSWETYLNDNTTAVEILSAADLTAAAVPVTYTYSGGTRNYPTTRYDLEREFSFRITSPTELSKDRWFAVRALGTQPLNPVVLTASGVLTPEVMSQPMYLDIAGNGWESPCTANPADCTQ